jgi:hypothetical protein
MKSKDVGLSVLQRMCKELLKGNQNGNCDRNEKT